MGGVGMLTSLGGDAAAGAGSAGSSLAGAAGSASTTPGAPSSLWDSALSTTKSILTTPGIPSLIGGLLNSYNQADLINAQMKWQEEHAPGQIAGGAANAWKGFPTSNPNVAASSVSPTTPTPATLKAPQPYNVANQPPIQTPMPGYGQSLYSAGMPGYGTPGYGQQPPAGQGLIDQGPNTLPYMDDPYGIYGSA
jgi:hypothetical protein